ncbi:MAG: putative Ig domain-containing protein [Candidatus Acidiferrales bacterium]
MKSTAFAQTLPAVHDAGHLKAPGHSSYTRTAFLLLRVAMIVCIALLADSLPASAQIVAATDGPGGTPTAVAVNPATNKIYVANELGQNILVIDGATNAGTVINTPGSSPSAIAVNPITNTIYAVNQNNNTVTVINGATNAISSVNAGGSPFAVVVNPSTNTIYIASQCDPSASPFCGNGLITVINGADNSTTAFTAGNAGDSALALAANPVTNKIYVAESRGNNVAMIDGASNTITTIATGNFPVAVAVNPVTNKIYAVNQTDGTVTVIDGASNTATSTITVGTQPSAVAVNSVTNKIYVANFVGSNSVTVIDGATSTATTTVSVGLGPRSVAVNSTTNQVYVADYTGGAVTVIDGATNTVTATLTTGSLPIAQAVNPVTGKVYVANNSGNSITVIDGDTNTTATVSTGAAPRAVGADPVTNKVYVANASGNSVSVIDRNANTTTTVAVGNNPTAVAVNPASGKVYVANQGDGTVTAIDESSYATTTTTVGSQPSAVAVNPVTNTVYLANSGSASLTVINAGTSAASTVSVGNNPSAVAVNPATNQVYVANQADGTVTVVDGATNNTSTVTVGSQPGALALNSVTNQVYVANFGDDTVTIIGAGNNTSTVTTGSHPFAIAVDPAANEVYVANQGDNTVTAIDGDTNNTSTVTVGSQPGAVAVNPVSNRIYVPNQGDGTVTVIEGAPDPSVSGSSNNRRTTTLSAGNQPTAVAVNPATGEIYVANQTDNTITVIDEQRVQTIPLQATVAPLPSNSTLSLTPTFSFVGASSFTPTDPAVDAVFYQVDTWQGSWLTATSQGAGAFSGSISTLLPGFHILYFYATDGEEATSTNSGSPLIGNIGSYGFLAGATQVTPTITWPTPAPITYGTPLSDTQLDATASVQGTFTYSPATGTVLTAGTQTLSVSFTPTDTTDYTTTTATVMLVVNQATPTISWATPGTILYGTALSGIQLNATSSVPGTFTYSPAAGAVLSVGNQTLSAIFEPTDTTDYTKVTTTVALVVSPPPPTITSPSSGSSLTTSSVTITWTGMAGASVTILDGATPIGTSTADSNGNFNVVLTLAIGSHTLTATQMLNGVISAASATVSLTIVAPPPAVIVDNETITVTDTVSFPDAFGAESVKVTDQITVYAFFPIAINPAPPILSAVLNQPYSGVSFSGTGGYQGLTLSETGAVPGMSFAIAGASATFSGTPTQAGTFPFSITATDSIGDKLSQTYSLMVSATCPAISVSPSGSLGIVTAGNPFSQMFTASGGVGTTTWSATGALPLGMSFSTGVLSGIPAQSGGFALTVTGTDQNGCQGSSNVSFLVVPPPAVIVDNETITVTDTPSFPDVFDAESVKVTDQVFVQVTSPTTTSISAPGVVYGTLAVVTVSVGSPYGSVSGNVTLSVDGGAPTTMNLSSGSAVFNAGILTPGTHSLAASFPAQGSFLASSATGAVFVSQPPVFTSANTTTFTVGAAGTLAVTTTGAPYPSLSIPPGTLPSGVTFTDNLNGTGTLAGTSAPGTGGIYALSISANNGVGAPVIQSFTLTVDQAPAITSGSSTTFTEGVAGSFTLTSTGFPIPALSESPTLPSGLNFFDNGDGTATLSGTPAAGTQGSYPITFVAANGVGTNATQNFTLAINLGPAITSGSGTTFTEQMPGSFLVTTLGFPVPSLTEAGTLPTGVTFTDNQDGTASLAGTPAMGTSNIYPITITANSGAGASTTQAFTLTVNSTAAITSGSTTTFTVGSPGFFSITALGTPAPALTFTGNLPTGVTFVDNGNGTATLSGTPTAGTANSYPLAITANNGVGTAAVQNFTLVVNQGAAILSGNSTTFTVGVQGTFTVMTSGSPTPTLTETPPLLPTGVTFVDNGDGTATLSGTPAAGTGGAYPITITANNGVDLPAMQTFTLNINQNPAITSSNIVTFNELVMGSFVVMSTGNPIPALTEVGSLPNGVTFTDNGDGTAFLGGVPAAGSAGQYGFTITAANGVLPSATQTFTLTVVPGLSFTSPNTTTFIVGEQNTFTITTAGTPTPTLTCSGRLPGGITFTRLGNGTATLSGVPQGGTEGSYSITFAATNGTGASAMQAFTLTVQAPGVDSAPVITSANHATFAFGLVAGNGGTIPYNFFKVTTTGFPVPKLTAKFVAQGTVAGGTVPYFHDNGDGTATISFAPSYTGTDRFTITATGAGGLTTTQPFTLLIEHLLTPRFTSASEVGFTVGVPNSFTVAAGPFVDQITAGSGLPAGVSLTDNHDGTATLHGTPNSITGQTGTYMVGFTASNPNTNAFHPKPYTATQTFTLAVLP